VVEGGRGARRGRLSDPNQWSTFDLTNLSDAGATLKQFHGGAAPRKAASFKTNKWIYLAPHGTGPNFPGIAVRWDSSQPLGTSTAWETINLASVDMGLAGSLVYDAVVSDDSRYLYYVPAANGTANGGDVMRYDTTGAFTDPASWLAYHFNQVNFTTGGWDGRYLYLSGSNSTIQRYDSTGTFTDYHAWDSFNAANVNANAKAFFGTASDGRYMYFVPDTFSTLVRLDASFPQVAIGGPRQSSFY
jgi:hypothetical protein